jgi:D-amino peptidase
VTVAVKESFGRFSARNIAPSKARKMIEDGAFEALSTLGNAPAPYDPGSPCEIKVEYATPDLTPKFRYRHGIETVDPRTIVSRAPTWLEAWRQFYF